MNEFICDKYVLHRSEAAQHTDRPFQYPAQYQWLHCQPARALVSISAIRKKVLFLIKHAPRYHQSLWQLRRRLQKPIALAGVVSAKHRQPDPFDLEADDHIPLRQRMGEHGSMYTVSGGSVGKDYGGDGPMARQEPLGRPRGWDDPTLEADYKRESTGEQN